MRSDSAARPTGFEPVTFVYAEAVERVPVDEAIRRARDIGEAVRA